MTASRKPTLPSEPGQPVADVPIGSDTDGTGHGPNTGPVPSFSIPFGIRDAAEPLTARRAAGSFRPTFLQRLYRAVFSRRVAELFGDTLGALSIFVLLFAGLFLVEIFK
ncbi:MAG: hypothetical protein ACFB11_00640 [Paracoccaceae bacterium]